MNADAHLRLMIGDAVAQIAMLAADRDELRGQLVAVLEIVGTMNKATTDSECRALLAKIAGMLMPPVPPSNVSPV